MSLEYDVDVRDKQFLADLIDDLGLEFTDDESKRLRQDSLSENFNSEMDLEQLKNRDALADAKSSDKDGKDQEFKQPDNAEKQYGSNNGSSNGRRVGKHLKRDAVIEKPAEDAYPEKPYYDLEGQPNANDGDTLYPVVLDERLDSDAYDKLMEEFGVNKANEDVHSDIVGYDALASMLDNDRDTNDYFDLEADFDMNEQFEAFDYTDDRLDEFWREEGLPNRDVYGMVVNFMPRINFIADGKVVVENPSVRFREEASQGLFDNMTDLDYETVCNQVRDESRMFYDNTKMSLTQYVDAVVLRLSNAIPDNIDNRNLAINMFVDDILGVVRNCIMDHIGI